MSNVQNAEKYIRIYNSRYIEFTALAFNFHLQSYLNIGRFSYFLGVYLKGLWYSMLAE